MELSSQDRARQKIDREKRRRHLVEQLSHIGIRPPMIRTAIGGGISQKDIVRIYEGTTPLKVNERLGRGFAVSRIRSSMTPTRIYFHSEWSRQVISLIKSGAEPADAIAAIWRITATREGRQIHEPTGTGINAEEFCAVCMNMLSGQVEMLRCNLCHHEYIAETGTRAPCPTCTKDDNLRRNIRPCVIPLDIDPKLRQRFAA